MTTTAARVMPHLKRGALRPPAKSETNGRNGMQPCTSQRKYEPSQLTNARATPVYRPAWTRRGDHHSILKAKGARRNALKAEEACGKLP
mmetsp:Transcript_53066/g.164442  ORF Transcript_53066/g.164442 Transcript_53066/m.164442 type:complete len:89 (+) Transcript_53066:662-928(+)